MSLPPCFVTGSFINPIGLILNENGKKIKPILGVVYIKNCRD
jgi:hypothetical protein